MMRLLASVLLFGFLIQASVRERMERGIALVQAGEASKARALFESTIAESPQHGPARLQLGQLAVARADWAEASEHLEIAVASSPHRPHLAWHLLGRARSSLGDAAGARSAFERALELAPDFAPARAALAELAAQENDLFTALAHYRHLVASGPAAAEAYAPLANTARRMGATDLARCAAREALKREPGNGALWYLKAVIEEQDGDLEEAIASCRKALELGYENAAVYITLGNLYHEKMRLSESIAAFEKAVALDPAAAESLASFALTSLTTRDYERLRRLLESHVEKHPESVNTLYGLGAMYLRENALEKAEATFLRLKELLPEASQVHYNLAMIYRRLGRASESRAATDRFRELKDEEDAEWNRANEIHLLRIRMKDAVASGEHGEAVAIGSRIAREDAEVEDLVLLGGALLKLRRWEEAKRVLDEALAKNPYDRDALESRLELAASLDDAEAAALYRERLELLAPECTAP